MANTETKSGKTEFSMKELQLKMVEMQNEVANRAKWTQGFILLMTLIAFILGVMLVIIAIFQVFLNGDYVFGAFSSAGGLASVFGTLLYNPMKKAQQSMGDLAQVHIAFLGFSSKVTIWIEYVNARAGREHGFEIASVKEISQDIEAAASNALQQIQEYCEPEQKKTEDKPKTSN